MNTRTDRQALIEGSLTGTTLPEYVQTRRASGLSWRRIALDLGRDTGHDVTGEALRQWFGREVAA